MRACSAVWPTRRWISTCSLRRFELWLTPKRRRARAQQCRELLLIREAYTTWELGPKIPRHAYGRCAYFVHVRMSLAASQGGRLWGANRVIHSCARTSTTVMHRNRCHEVSARLSQLMPDSSFRSGACFCHKCHGNAFRGLVAAPHSLSAGCSVRRARTFERRAPAGIAATTSARAASHKAAAGR